MKLQFLGTGAADWPSDPAKCEGGFRRNASAIVDDAILIDPGPGVINAIETFGIDVDKIRCVINTHKHGDHYCRATLDYLAEHSIPFIDMKAGETVRLDEYEIKAYRANHGTCTEAVHFLITDGKSKLYYALDSAWLYYEEYIAIKAAKVDYLVLDATVGHAEGDSRIFEHNNLRMVLEMQKTLKKYVKRFCISHMAYTLHDPHDVLVKDMEPYAVEVAADGMTVEF